MTTNYLSTTTVDARIGGSAVRLALFTPDDADGAYDSAAFDAVCQSASTIARAAAENSGYSPGDSTTNDLLIQAAFGQFVRMAYGRKAQSVPIGFELETGLAEAIRTGAVPIPGLTADTFDGVGGVRFSPITGTNSKPRIMGRLRKVY